MGGSPALAENNVTDPSRKGYRAWAEQMASTVTTPSGKNPDELILTQAGVNPKGAPTWFTEFALKLLEGTREASPAPIGEKFLRNFPPNVANVIKVTATKATATRGAVQAAINFLANRSRRNFPNAQERITEDDLTSHLKLELASMALAVAQGPFTYALHTLIVAFLVGVDGSETITFEATNAARVTSALAGFLQPGKTLSVGFRDILTSRLAVRLASTP